MAERSIWLAPQYDSLGQQHRASVLGMLVFLMTEIMLFGGLFVGYTVYRTIYPAGWAEGSRHLSLLLGGSNTAVLIISSLTMALAVHASQVGDRKALLRYLTLTMLIGLLFLGIKGLEWYQHARDQLVPGIAFHFDGPNARAVELFFLFYFLMTGLHALHLVIAVLLVGATLVLALRGTSFTGEHDAPIEVIGLYWHFVDVVWIFLLPLLYLFGLQA